MTATTQRRDADRHLLKNGPMPRDELVGWLMPRLSFGQWQSKLAHRKPEAAETYASRRKDDWEVGARKYASQIVQMALTRGTWRLSDHGLVSHRDWREGAHSDARRQLDLLRALFGAPTAEVIVTTILSLWRGQAWKELGYPSWPALTKAELSGAPRLTVEVRRDAVIGLRDEGMSTRAIGSALGVHHSTVEKDVSGGGNPPTEPKPVTGLDGKTYASHPSPADLPAAPKKRETSTNVDTPGGKRKKPPARPWHETFARSNDLVEQEALLNKHKPDLMRHIKQKPHPRERKRTRTHQGIAPVIDMEERRA